MAFLKLAFEKRKLARGESPREFFDHLRGDFSYLLESAGGSSGGGFAEGAVVGSGGRYSYIGWDPWMVVRSAKGVTTLEKKKTFFGFKKSAADQIVDGESLEVLRNLFKSFDFKGDSPVPFYGGGAGYFSYDYGCGFTGVDQKVFDDTEVPDYFFIFTDKNIAFDHESCEVYFLALAETETSAKRKLDEIRRDLARPVGLRSAGGVGKIASNLDEETYLQKLKKIKKFLEEGQTYQVNFSQRFAADCTYDSWAVYERLAKKSPAPFACFFDFGEFSFASSSPELLLRKRGMALETWPIKGTVRRGKTKLEDAELVSELMASKKDEAELAMIVDLERNDLGKVCAPGTVSVEAHREIQKLSHVIHTYSRVSGKLASRKDAFDVIEAVFPGGSITGCPKKRTMEIIDALEDYKRGIYTGSAGFISFSGDMDLNILIRTMLFKESRVYFQTGGGIVIDSDPAAEYLETLNKAEGMRRALMQ